MGQREAQGDRGNVYRHRPMKDPLVPGGGTAVTDKKVLELIKRVVLEEASRLGVSVERIILFGSRARGDYREDSDYDILVVVREGLDWRARRKLSLMIRRRLVRELGVPVDLVVVSLCHWEEYKDVPGTVLYPAEREGILIV